MNMRRMIMKILFCMMTLCIVQVGNAQTTNSMTEVIPFKTVDGKIIVEATVNGETADFVLNLAGSNALLPEVIKKFRIKTNQDGDYMLETLAMGQNIFGNNIPASALKDESYLRKLGVAGVLNTALFRNSVLTIDMQRKKLTITQPYRPSYIKLNYRESFELTPGRGVVCPISIQNKPVSLVLDTWSDGLINLTEEDFKAWSAQYPKGTPQKVANGYTEATQEEETLNLPETMFIKTPIEGGTAVKNPYLKRSVLGKKILDHGIVSIDFIHQRIYFQPFDLVPIPEAEAKVTEVKVEDGKMNPITRQYFLDHIFDYRKGGDFVYNGDKPVVIDFWATWCAPCMRLLPGMEELAEKYKGRVIFYKINADREKDLCNSLGVKALPTLFFIPAGGKPIVEVGAKLDKYVEIIEEQLLK